MTRNGPIRILYCEHNVDGTVGGSYYSLLYLVKGLDRTRYEPIVVFYAPHALLSAFADAGVETHVWPKSDTFAFASRTGTRRWFTTPLRLAQKGLNVWRGMLIAAVRRAWFLRRRGIRLVHLNNSVLHNHDWMLAARLASTPCVTHERGINDRFPSMARFFGKRLGAVICISNAVRNNMRQRGADFGNLTTIYNGLDPKALTVSTPPMTLRANHGLDADDVVVGMIGNIKAWKGQETLIRAMAIVRQEFPEIRCVLVGDTSPADRDYERSLRELVSSLDLDRQIIFTGYQQHVADFLLMVDVVVHASVLPEPFGRVILEAMACRKPVIGARAGAIPEIIEEGSTGLTFPPGDSDALAAAILRLLRDRREAERLGEAGYRRLESEFGIAGNVASTQQLYERLLGGD